jgi:hypothetical protein
MRSTNEGSTVLPTAEVDRLAGEIAELASHLDAATHHLLALIRRFDEGSGWYAHGASSCAHWLSWRIGLDLGAAREHVRVARALGRLPVLDDALRRGQVSYSKVRAITRVAAPDNEASLLEMARSSTASQLERICRGYRRALRGLGEERPEDEESRRYVRVRETDSGMVRIEAQLAPEEAAMVMKALEVAVARMRGGMKKAAQGVPGTAERAPGVSPEIISAREQRISRADALVAVAEGYLAAEADAGSGVLPVELIVHVDEATLRTAADPAGTAAEGINAVGTLEDGTVLSRQTTERLACDASVVRVIETSAGTPLDVGRRTRRISPALRRALRLRDPGGCRFPGCTNRLTDAHHIVPWARGGVTSLANLTSLCRRHHGLVHECGYRVELDEVRELAFIRPDGKPVPAIPSRHEVTADAFERLRAGRAGEGITIDAMTAFPRWDGEPVDYDHVVYSVVNHRGPGDDRARPTA